MAEEPIEQQKLLIAEASKMPTKLMLENAKKRKFAFRREKCIFRHDFPLPRLPFFLSFFFYLWESFLRRVSNFQEYATGKYEKKLRVGVNERRQIQSKLTEMLMVERQIDADSTNLAKTNKS